MAGASSYSVAGLALAFLGLTALADTLTAGTFSGGEPGYWNLGTTNVILLGVSDLVGQFVLGYLADARGVHYAMTVNASSILIASFVSLVSLFSSNGRTLTAIVAPLLKCLGGGSHASLFLALAALQHSRAIDKRSAYYYATGAVAVIAQGLGSYLVPLFAHRRHFLPCLVSTACCVLAYALALFYKRLNITSDLQGDGPGSPVRAPLLPAPEAPSQQVQQQPSHLASIAGWLDNYTGGAFSSKNGNMRFVTLIFFLMAISKATRPLFTNYIQHRAGVTAKQAQTLWLVRGIMSVAIFAILLPLAVLYLPPRISTFSSITLQIGKLSIILMGLGAFLIGLSGSLPVVSLALVVNTLGVATDLSVLAFSANYFTANVAGRVIMLIASGESIGTLIGIFILYPIYQWSLGPGVSFVAGGLPYYICAMIYSVVGGLIWSLTPSEASRQL